MHTIHLRFPWSKRAKNQTESVKVDVPEVEVSKTAMLETEATNPSLCGVIYTRSFNRPTGLKPGVSVLLSIHSWQGKLSQLQLNGAFLSVGEQPFAVDVTEQLEQHNQIELHLDPIGVIAPNLCGEVCLQIEA
ncbi:hypothetical protein CA13_46640 [Planctomycetes bacterium CA13]|uniref:Uncharacterized protein n=1 Tax=Novipirellula herctigrandis TaxID=2527986 RepID=A0A5C5Z8P1_9BACT|nr:hypothetical protein CA13_46640 [Planctomycetes bacterium CA13]